jgi:hypothetical protein
MKYLAVIWAILIFFLSCIPCTDSGESMEQDGLTMVQTDPAHHDAGADADLCSPLCECHCCGGVTLSGFRIKMGPPVVVLESQLPLFSPSGLPSPSFGFWHPPKA